MNSTLQLILSILNVIVALILTVLVLVQNGKSEGLDPFVGSKAETFFGKNKSRSIEAKLARATAWCAGIFVLLTFVLAIF